MMIHPIVYERLFSGTSILPVANANMGPDKTNDGLYENATYKVQ